MSFDVLRWPYPSRWAFGITDDTDGSTTESVRTIYERCLELDIRPTRIVWTHEACAPTGTISPSPADPGPTLEDAAYRAYCQELAARGIEMGLHGATSGNNLRDATVLAFDRFREVFGCDPSMFVCHCQNAENIYWGESHFTSGLARRVVRLLMRDEQYSGENEESPYYWGDICRERVRYVRLFRSRGANILRYNPSMPYHEYDKPDVRFWFSVNAQDLSWLSRVNPRVLDRIARDDGAIILYTHLSRYVADDGGVRPDADSVFRMIGARQDVWRTSVTRILDRCLAMKNLIVTRRRHATVLSNPTDVDLENVQIRLRSSRVFRADGTALEGDADGHLDVGTIPAGGCIALFDDAESARIGDPTGMPRRERARMLIEEAKRLVWQRWRWARGRET